MDHVDRLPPADRETGAAMCTNGHGTCRGEGGGGRGGEGGKRARGRKREGEGGRERLCVTTRRLTLRVHACCMQGSIHVASARAYERRSTSIALELSAQASAGVVGSTLATSKCGAVAVVSTSRSIAVMSTFARALSKRQRHVHGNALSPLTLTCTSPNRPTAQPPVTPGSLLSCCLHESLDYLVACTGHGVSRRVQHRVQYT